MLVSGVLFQEHSGGFDRISHLKAASRAASSLTLDVMKPYILSPLLGAAFFLGSVSFSAAQSTQTAKTEDGWGTEQPLTSAGDSTKKTSKSASLLEKQYATSDSASATAAAKPEKKTHISSYSHVSAAGISAAAAAEKAKPVVKKHRKLPKRKEHVHGKPVYPMRMTIAANDKRSYRNVYKPYSPQNSKPVR
jgi:hypothetical protein